MSKAKVQDLVSTKVNLLDCAQEPSDEQLAALMQSVTVEAVSKAHAANSALMQTLHDEVAQVRSRYRLASPGAIAKTA